MYNFVKKDCTTNFKDSLWRGDFNLQDRDRFNYEKNCSVSIKIFEFAEFAGREYVTYSFWNDIKVSLERPWKYNIL